jgi:hypothetical protein
VQVASDPLGNAGAGGSTATFTVDTVTPTVTLPIDNTFINKAHTTGTVTFTFSEAPTAFTLADASAVGGTLSNLAGVGNTYTGIFTGAAQTHITDASVSVTAGSWQENNSDPGDGGSSALFEVDTLSTPQSATITVSKDPTAVQGQVISLSTLVAISDRFGLGFQKLELWDSQGTTFGGQFVANGVPQTGGHEVDISPADIANTVFDVGTLGGTDTLWAQLLQNNGQMSGWQQFAVTAPIDTGPVVLPTSTNISATHNQSFAVSSLFMASEPGYWRRDLTSAAFDEDGFFRTGDALDWMDAANPQTGLRYAGRIAEDFKLATGTWVRVGALRENLLQHLAPEVRDLVIAGENRNYIAVLAVPADPNTDRQTHARLRAKLTALADRAGGSAQRVLRLVFLTEKLSIDAGELTDKGIVNQRNILRRHSALVEQLYADAPGDHVIRVIPGTDGTPRRFRIK